MGLEFHHRCCLRFVVLPASVHLSCLQTTAFVRRYLSRPWACLSYRSPSGCFLQTHHTGPPASADNIHHRSDHTGARPLLPTFYHLCLPSICMPSRNSHWL